MKGVTSRETGLTLGRWDCMPHKRGSDIYVDRAHPGHTLWPHGASIAGLTAADARLVGAAPALLAALRGLMAAEGGEPGESPIQRAAWADAERAIAAVEGPARRGRR